MNLLHLHRRSVLVLALAGATTVAQAQAQPDEQEAAPPEAVLRILYLRTLETREVRLAGLTDTTISLLDLSGKLFSLPRDQVLALVPPLTGMDAPVLPAPPPEPTEPPVAPARGAEPARPPGTLVLNDGQVFFGSLVTDSAEKSADQIRWQSTLFGRLTLPLDVVSAIQIQPEPPRAPGAAGAPVADTIVLLNGDRAEGFVAEVGATVQLEKDGKVSVVPLDRVATVRLANPQRPPQGTWVWLADGTAAALSRFTVSSAGDSALAAALPPPAPPTSAVAFANDLRAICFDAAAVRPLSALPAVSRPGPGAPRRWVPPVKVDDPRAAPLFTADIELPGPMVAEWNLPAGATRLSAIAELPAAARTWGDCELVVESVDARGQTKLLARQRMNAAAPSQPLAVPIAGAAKLRMTIDPGPSGPIQDRIVLRRAFLLMGSSLSAP